MKIKELAILLLCVATASCRTIEPISDQSSKPAVEIMLSASSEDSSTKVVAGQGNTINWVKDDRISLLNDEGSFFLELEEGAGTTCGTFKGEVSEAVTSNVGGSVAAYPHSAQNSLESDILTVEWNGHLAQTAVKDSFDPASCLMAGIVDSDGCISFRNIMSYIKFSVDFNCKTVTVNNLAAATPVKVRFDGDGIPVVQKEMMDWSQSKTVTLGGANGGVIEKGSYMLAVLPQELSGGFSISFTDEDGKVYTKTTLKTATLARGHILNIGSFSRASMKDGSAFEGNGTEASPYLITSFQKLKLLEQKFSDKNTVDAYKGKYFKQTCDIDCKGQPVHIGHFIKSTSGDMDAPFDGTYDGNGKKITDFHMCSLQMRNDRYACGLFPYVKDATIKHLSVSPHIINPINGLILNASEQDQEYVIGCLVGLGTAGYYTTSGTTITDCHVLKGSYQINGISSSSSTVSAFQYVVYGGIVGTSPQKIEISDCTSDADVFVYGGYEKGMSNDIEAIAGGIIGKVHNADGEDWTSTAEIRNCRNNGTVYIETTADNAFSGGIAGYIYDQGFGDSLVHILNCVNSGNICAYGEKECTFAGGIIGFNNSDGDVDDNYKSRNPWVYNCLNTGLIEATNGENCSAAGIIGAGYDSDTEVIYCINTGSISARSLTSTAVNAALCGKATSLLTSIPAYCIGCYWLSTKRSDGEPDLPITGTSDPDIGSSYKSGDYFDSYFYQKLAASGADSETLTPGTINSRIYNGLDAKDSTHGCSEWTKDEWRARAGKWIYRDGNLDIDFYQRINL